MVAEHHDRPVVFSLSDIHLVQPLTESFKRNERFYRLTEDLSFYPSTAAFSVYSTGNHQHNYNLKEISFLSDTLLGEILHTTRYL